MLKDAVFFQNCTFWHKNRFARKKMYKVLPKKFSCSSFNFSQFSGPKKSTLVLNFPFFAHSVTKPLKFFAKKVGQLQKKVLVALLDLIQMV